MAAAGSIVSALKAAKLNVVTVTFNGEASKEEVARITEIGHTNKVST